MAYMVTAYTVMPCIVMAYVVMDADYVEWIVSGRSSLQTTIDIYRRPECKLIINRCHNYKCHGYIDHECVS